MASTTLTDRAVIRLSGEGVRGFLQGLVTSDVEGELPVWAGLLTPQGKCLFDFLVWKDGEDLLLDCEAEAADDLIKRLAIYRLRRPITIERNPGLAAHWSLDGSEGVPDPRLGDLGRRWLAPAADPATGWLDHRLNLGVTEGRAELGDILWLECNAAELNGVSFSKGCFVGQEIVIILPYDEIEQAFALGRKQPCPHRQVARDIARHQSLKEFDNPLARQTNNRAIGEGGGRHDP